MSAELISILALVAIFVIGAVMNVNMGPLAFAAAFIVGTLAGGMTSDEILGGFPGSLFLVLVGVTYLFAIARANGTIDWVVSQSVRMVGGRMILLPWVMLFVSALLAAIGAPVPGAVAIVAPIALSMAAKYGINKLLVGVMIVHGTLVGGYSPISVFGVITNGVVDAAELPGSPLALFLSSAIVNLVFAAVAFVVLGGLKLSRERVITVEEPTTENSGTGPEAGAGAGGGVDVLAKSKLTWHAIATLVGILTMVVLVLWPDLDLDLGLVAITVAVVLGVISPKVHEGAISKISWPTVLLICGVLTYVGVLQEMGTIDYVSNAVSSIGAPLIAALVLCYIGAVVSAFASTTGLLGALIPLAVPLMAAGSVGPIGMVSALAISSSVVDISPFSTSGALILANCDESERERFYRQLVTYGAVMVVTAPILMWLVFLVPNFG